MVWGLGSRGQGEGLGFRVEGLGLRVEDLGFRVEGVEFTRGTSGPHRRSRL